MKTRMVGMTAIAVLLLLLPFLAVPVHAIEIDVTNYGTTTNGMPYAVGMARGFFKEAGANITGIRGSEGGGTTIRNMLGGNMPYGSPALPPPCSPSRAART